jgi:hypothetical protein
MRLPASGDAAVLDTLTLRLFEDASRARFHQEMSHVFTELSGLFRGGCGTLLHILRTINGADARFDNQLTSFDARPRPDWNLASSVKSTKHGALGNNRGARLGVVELGE